MGYDLERFIKAQQMDYEIAYKEISEGCKRSHWMWYIFPQIAGLGYSPMAKMYEIADLDEAKAYMENEYLRNNLIEITRALLNCGEDDIEKIMGFPDDLKLRSCMTLFEFAAPEIEVFGLVLDKFFNADWDNNTVAIILGDNAPKNRAAYKK